MSDQDLDEIECTPDKLAGLVVVSNELAADSDPSALDVVDDGLVRFLQIRLDAAYFGNTVANSPDGLLSLTDVQVISWESVTTLDCFAEALSLAETVGSVITTFIGNPVDTLMLAQLKSGTGLATPLLGIDPAAPTQRTIFGVPLISSPAVTPGAFWAVPKAKAFTVLRDDAAVVTDASPFFSSDRTAVRCTIRAGFAFPHLAAIIRIDHGGS